MILSLKKKTCLILLIAGALFAGTDFAVQRWAILPRFASLELSEAKKDMQRCLSAIQREADHLDTFCVGWAAWDDTYEFVRDHNTKYVQANMTLETFKANGLDFLFLVDELEQLVHGEVIIDGAKSKLGVLEILGPYRYRLLKHEDLDSSICGIMLTPQGPALVSSRPIQTSQHKGPARGSLIMGRFLNSERIKKLRDQTCVAMRVEALSDGELPPELTGNPSVIDCGDGMRHSYRDANTTEMFGVMPGVDNRPALLASAHIPRRISQASESASRFAMITLILTCATMVAVILTLLQWSILNPLCRLASRVMAAGRGEEVTHFSEGQQDEVGLLAGQFERTFRDLKSAMDELVRARQAADQANGAKSDFLAKMSHEIRTPLNGVVGAAHLLMESGLSSNQQRYGRIIQASADSLLGLINDILDISKIEAGKMDLREEDFRVHELVEGVVEMFSQRGEEKNLTLAAVIQPAVPTVVRGDADRLRQILINLVGNALKFTEHGSVTVRVLLEETDNDHTILRFSVSDTGIGIAHQDKELLFQTFSQLDTGPKRRFGGTGLGLVISKRLVEMMGGQIGLESELGQGATFTFTARFGAVRGEPARALAANIRRTAVLVANSNADQRSALAEQLGLWGFPVLTAGTVEDMRTSLSGGGRERVEVLILDAQLGGGDVQEIIREIRKGDLTKHVVCILTVSQNELETQTWKGKDGAHACLVRPIRQSQLFDVLAQSLGHSRSASAKGGIAAGFAHLVRSVGARVLLVEDNEVNAALGKEILTKAGYQCDLAVDGIDGVDAALRTRYDLVLMDCQMPRMDGLEATRVLRRKEQEGVLASRHGGHLPVIALTADAISEDRDRCMNAGMDDFVSKPISPAVLIQAIERALEGKFNPAMA